MILPSQVKEAVLKSGKTWIPHHDCSICGQYVGYHVINEDLYFSSSCGCGSSGVHPVPWSEASEWINMQSTEDAKKLVAAKFFITL